jgi:hypothetical protein
MHEAWSSPVTSGKEARERSWMQQQAAELELELSDDSAEEDKEEVP